MSYPGPALRSHAPEDFDIDTDDDAYSVASLPPFSPPPSVGASSHTSYDVSMRSGSPAPSVWSMTSSIRAQAFKQEFGRGINNYSEVYRLPADDEELERLEKQHAMFKELMGNYPPPMYEVMADDVPGETKACLDLGCGAGSWIIDCAQDFPHSQTVAVDLVPMQSLSMPPNCRSEVDDINLGLEHFYGDFNVVHAQLIASGIKDYPGLIDHISRVIRPGGLIIMIEWDFHVWDHNYKQVKLGTHEIGPPWWARWLAFAQIAVRNSGGSADAAEKLHSWISNHPAFEDVVSEDFWIPASHWARGDEFQMRLGATMRDDILAFLNSGRPLLLGSGVPEPIVNEIQHNAAMELKGALQPQYIRLQRVYARKKQH
ncbi:Secondary metabolism regulator laeA [Hypsizygus marmoreus]|uniref:Secondary metabolism regulator laeA n=1 Tax=Hypsizygus marmoreus TaxID=39966 RepID=A0A369K6I9_HYPMA|nr:Secondary metabolism regulator laeA [Hypsizygus marmoreus]